MSKDAKGRSLTKPCGACGKVDRYPSTGKCQPCTRAQLRAYHGRRRAERERAGKERP